MKLFHAIKLTLTWNENKKSEKVYLNYTFASLYSNFFSGQLTKMQQKEMWNELRGKNMRWKVYVKNIDSSWHAEYQLLGLKDPPEQFTVGSDIGISFKKEEISKLLEFYKGDVIEFEGILDSYGNIIGSKIFYVKDAVVTGKGEVKPANMPSGNSWTSICKDLQQQCDVYNECEEIRSAKSGGIC